MQFCYLLLNKTPTVLLVLMLLSSGIYAQVCINTEPLVYGPSRRVASHFFNAANSLDEEHSPKEVRLPSGNSWCSAELGFSIDDPFLELNFGADVIIQSINISGNVTQFRIQYSTMDEDHLQFLTGQGSEIPQVFAAVGRGDEVSSVVLGDGVPVLSRLVLLPYTWTANPLCLRMEVYGCLSSPECETEVNIYNSRDLNFLPKDNIKDMNGQPAFASFDDGNYSCFSFGSDSATSDFPMIILNFTQPVVITRAATLFPVALSGGNGNEEHSYVNHYTVEVSADGENYTSYTDAAGNQNILTDAVNTFWRPVKTEQFIRLTIVDAKTAHSQVCWHIELYGCSEKKNKVVINSTTTTVIQTMLDFPTSLLNTKIYSTLSQTSTKSDNSTMSIQDGMGVINSTPTITHVQTPIREVPTLTSQLIQNMLMTPLPSSSSTSVVSEGGRIVIEYRKDYLLLEVFAPFAAGTIFVIVLICVIGVCCCCSLKRMADYKLKLLSLPLTTHPYSPSIQSRQGSQSRELDNAIKVQVQNTVYNSGNIEESESLESQHCTSMESASSMQHRKYVNQDHQSSQRNLNSHLLHTNVHDSKPRTLSPGHYEMYEPTGPASPLPHHGYEYISSLTTVVGNSGQYDKLKDKADTALQAQVTESNTTGEVHIVAETNPGYEPIAIELTSDDEDATIHNTDASRNVDWAGQGATMTLFESSSPACNNDWFITTLSSTQDDMGYELMESTAHDGNGTQSRKSTTAPVVSSNDRKSFC